MKKIFFKASVAVALAVVIFAACKKQETEIYSTGGTAPVLTSSIQATDTLALSAANANIVAGSFNWTNPNYQFSDGISSLPVTYIIYVDIAGDNFVHPAVLLDTSIGLGTAITVQTLNSALFNQLDLTPGTLYSMQIKIVSSIIKYTV